MQLREKLTVSGFTGTKDSVTVAWPLVAFAPGHASLAPPPLVVQLLALVELHVRVIDGRDVIVVGDTASNAVTTGHVTTTGTCA